MADAVLVGAKAGRVTCQAREPESLKRPVLLPYSNLSAEERMGIAWQSHWGLIRSFTTIPVNSMSLWLSTEQCTLPIECVKGIRPGQGLIQLTHRLKINPQDAFLRFRASFKLNLALFRFVFLKVQNVWLRQDNVSVSFTMWLMYVKELLSSSRPWQLSMRFKWLLQNE